MKKFKKFLSLNDYRNQKYFDDIVYRQYLIDLNLEDSRRVIDINHLENIFNNQIYYLAMKKVPLLEKKVLYLNICENEDLDIICEILKLSRKQVIKLRTSGIRHFRENLKKYNKAYSKKNGGASNG